MTEMLSISWLELEDDRHFWKLTLVQRGPYKEIGNLTFALPDYINKASGFLSPETENLSPHNILQS